MKIAAEQEPKRPSLRHRLEGENRPNCANYGKEGRTTQSYEDAKAAKSRATPCKLNYHATKPLRVELPHKAAKKAASHIDADETQGSKTRRWMPHT